MRLATMLSMVAQAGGVVRVAAGSSVLEWEGRDGGNRVETHVGILDYRKILNVDTVKCQSSPSQLFAA